MGKGQQTASSPQKRWMPDEQMIPAILAGNTRKMGQLGDSDRSWVVAGLTLAGLTAEEVADRLDCSVRLVRSIRAQDMTQICTLMQTDARNFTDELRLAIGELRAREHEIAEVRAELDRVRGARDRLIDEKIAGVRLCERGHAMDKYNTYRNDKTGIEYCRTCRRDYQQEFRDTEKLVPSGVSGLVLAGYENRS